MYVWKNEIRSLPLIIHKNQLKVDQRLKYQTWNCEDDMGENIWETLPDVGIGNVF